MKEIIIEMKDKNMEERKRGFGEFNDVVCPEGWSVLETEQRGDYAGTSFAKDFWCLPGNRKPDHVIIVAGEWKEGSQKMRYIVKGTTYTTDYDLFKFMKYESVIEKVQQIMKKTDKKFEKDYAEWTEKYNFDPNKEWDENYEEPIWY